MTLAQPGTPTSVGEAILIQLAPRFIGTPFAWIFAKNAREGNGCSGAPTPEPLETAIAEH